VSVGNGRVPSRPTKGASDATAAAFLAREGAGGSAGLAQEVGGFAVARLTQALGGLATTGHPTARRESSLKSPALAGNAK
jgi:hypothetical protein